MKIDSNDAFRYETEKKKALISQKVVLPLLATASGAADREWEREEWETTSECKYRAAEANILNKAKPMVDLH